MSFGSSNPLPANAGLNSRLGLAASAASPTTSVPAAPQLTDKEIQAAGDAARADAAAAAGRASTILTSGLGVTGRPELRRKTLLGA